MKSCTATASQLCFRICHEESPWKQWWTETAWDTSTCGWYKYIGKKNTVRKNIDHLLVTKKEDGTTINAGKITCVYFTTECRIKSQLKDKVSETVACFIYLGITIG